MTDKVIFEAIGEILKEEKSATDQRIAEVKDAIEKRIAELPAPKDGQDADPLVVKELILSDTDFIAGLKGEQGEAADPSIAAEILKSDEEFKQSLIGAPGEPGEDGTDRFLVAPREIGDDDKLDKNEVVYWRGGLFQTTRKAIGSPDRDPHSYKSILTGIDEIITYTDTKSREAVSEVRLSDGEVKEIRSELPAGYCEPCEKQLAGDFYIEGSTLKTYDGEAWSEMDLRGSRGRTGRQGEGVKKVALSDDGVVFEMTTGKSFNLPMVERVAEFVLTEYKDIFADMAAAEVVEVDQEIKRFEGSYKTGKSYAKGDVVRHPAGLYLALKSTSANLADKTAWAQMFEVSTALGGGGGGGGGASAFLGQTWRLGGTMNMNNYGIVNVAPPRTGVLGQKDATNKQYVDQAIAAGALYQGIYTIATNNPDLAGKTDSGFTPPTAGTNVAQPQPAAGGAPAAGNITTWHNWAGNGFDSFAATTTAPKPISVMLSDGRILTHNIDPKAYADEAALVAELEAKFVEPEIAHFFVYVNGTDCHIGVETVGAAPYCTAISDETGNAFPAAVIGVGNTVLNTYNWICSTRDSNVPEALPPGIPGLAAGTVVKNSDVLQYSGTKKGFEVISGSSLTQSFSDQRYWQITTGNMAWVDQAYNQGAIVYSARHNSFFTATQNITAGTLEPGGNPGNPAGAEWRKVNSTYGATVFFGKGDYDSSDTTAANRWGMPASTYPGGQQPLNGDSYFDVTTGTTVDFNVTSQPPVYTLSVNYVRNTGKLGDLTAAQLNNFPSTLPVATSAGQYYLFTNTTGAPINVTGGLFAGQTIPTARNIVLVYSGDPDADNNGWIYHLGEASATLTTNTPHPQNVPDVITATTSYGTVRRFTEAATGAADQTLQLIKGFPLKNALFSFEIRDLGPDGSIYTGQVSLSATTPKVDMTPNVVRVDVNSFAKVLMGYNAADGYYLAAVLKADGVGRNFEILVDTQDFDLGLLSTGAGAIKPASEELRSFATEADFKPASATRIMQYSNGSANNTYGYNNTRLHARLVSTKANTLYKMITNTAWYGYNFTDGAKLRINVFYAASNDGSGNIGAPVDIFRCIGVNIVNPHVKSYRIVGATWQNIEVELTMDAHSSPGAYVTLEMNFDMIGGVSVPAGNQINYGMKAVSGVTTMPPYVRFPEVSIFEIASWT